MFGGIHRIAHDIVARDGDHVHAFLTVLISQGHEFRQDVDYKRAVVAHEDHHGRTSGHHVIPGEGAATDRVRKFKVGGCEAEGNRGGRGARHGSIRCRLQGRRCTGFSSMQHVGAEGQGVATDEDAVVGEGAVELAAPGGALLGVEFGLAVAGVPVGDE